MEYIAIIPARGGSKGINNKNLRLVGDKSLVARAVLSAKEVDAISRIIVSTDDTLIEKEALKYGAEIHRRRDVTSSDTAKTIDVIKDVCEDKGLIDDICVLLQPTSPLRQAQHINECIHKFEGQGFLGSVITGTICEHHPYKTVVFDDGKYRPIRQLADLEAPRQQLPHALRINGAVYVISLKSLIKDGSFFSQPIVFVEMSEDDSIDIDNYSDLEKANLLIKGR